MGNDIIVPMQFSDAVFVHYTACDEENGVPATGYYSRSEGRKLTNHGEAYYAKKAHTQHKGFSSRFLLQSKSSSAWKIGIRKSPKKGAYCTTISLAESTGRQIFSNTTEVSPSWHGHTWSNHTKTTGQVQPPIVFGKGDFFTHFCVKSSELKCFQVKNISESGIMCTLWGSYSGVGSATELCESGDAFNFDFENTCVLKKLSPNKKNQWKWWMKRCEETSKAREEAAYQLRKNAKWIASDLFDAVEEEEKISRNLSKMILNELVTEYTKQESHAKYLNDHPWEARK